MAIAAALLLARPLVPVASAADDRAAKQKCIEAFESGQGERDSGALLAARTHLLACADPGCPSAITRECRRLLDDLTPKIPSVSFRARDAAGSPLTDVVVRVEGIADPVASDAPAVELDPGPHAIVWERAGETLRREVIELSLGERGRVVSVVVAAPTVVAPPPAPAPTSASPKRLGIAPWVLGAVGVAGVATFAVLGLSVRSDLRRYDRCFPACDRGEVTDTQRRAFAADAALGVGVTALVAAGWWILRQRSGSERDDRVAFIALPDGCSLSGSF